MLLMQRLQEVDRLTDEKYDSQTIMGSIFVNGFKNTK